MTLTATIMSIINDDSITDNDDMDYDNDVINNDQSYDNHNINKNEKRKNNYEGNDITTIIIVIISL